jgi:hypothetical protein
MSNSFGREFILGQKQAFVWGRLMQFLSARLATLQQGLLLSVVRQCQFPASAGNSAISAATHKAIQIRKFFASASSFVFMVRSLEFMMTM